VARDPNYALAHATLAYLYVDMGLGVAGALPSDEAFRRGKAAAARALEIDPQLPEGNAVLGYLTFGAEFDWERGEALLKRAIDLDPNSADAYDFYGLLLAAQERFDEAIAMQRRAYELDPLGHRMDIATSYLRAGRYDDALASVTGVLEAEPHLPLGHATLGWAYLLGGRPDQGIAALEKAVSLAPDNTMYRSQLGQALAMAGRSDEARDLLRQLEELSRQRYVSPYHMAYVLTGLGDHEGAMDWLERAYRERAGSIFGIKGSFLFRALRPHPRFQALLRKMNLA